MPLILSAQQQIAKAFVESGRGSAVIEAVAGSGKTTTLIELVKVMKGNVAFMAYNKKIADEIGAKLRAAGIGPNVRSGTVHSFGKLALRGALPKGGFVDDTKRTKVVELLQASEIDAVFHKFVEAAVSHAKSRMLGFLGSIEDEKQWFDIVEHFQLDELLSREGADDGDLDGMTEEGIHHAQQLLKQSTEVAKQTGWIDFDDMVYLPPVLGVRMFQNDWVLVDEAQDTNPARRALVKKMLKPGGRVIAVGDRHQAIYGFTGADADSLDLIAKEFACTYLPLTVTYRCPVAVVEHARQWVSHIEAHEFAPRGEVRTINEAEFGKLPATALTREEAVLCRNTKPLVTLAYQLIRKRIPCHVEGRDIGQGLLALTNKWKVRSLNAFADKLEEYLARETDKLMTKGQEQKAAAVADKVETMMVLIAATQEGRLGATLNDLRTEIAALFQDTQPGTCPNLTLSTVHKSKGREWNTVYLLGRNLYMPSKFARQAWQLEQENNLCYVAVTRAKQTLVEVSVA